MLIGQSKRIHWYLELQRLFTSPRKSFAPTAAQLRRARGNQNGNHEENGASKRRNENSDFIEHLRHTAAWASPVSKNLTYSSRYACADAAGRTTDRAHQKYASHQLDRHTERQADAAAETRQASVKHSGRTAFSRGLTSLAPERRKLAEVGRDQRDRVSKVAVSPSLGNWPATVREAEWQRSFAPGAGIRSDQNSYANMMYATQNSQTPPLRQGMMGEPLGSPAQQLDAAKKSSSRQNRAVSMLHIDGSSLGRWAVQHLERSLNKFTPGMTGIDPRATIPRSRVAPF